MGECRLERLIWRGAMGQVPYRSAGTLELLSDHLCPGLRLAGPYRAELLIPLMEPVIAPCLGLPGLRALYSLCLMLSREELRLLSFLWGVYRQKSFRREV